MSGRVLIAGLGNVLMSDDAIGPYCIAMLRAGVDVPSYVEVADLGAPGVDLARHLSTVDRVIAVDAMRSVEPGSLYVMEHLGVCSRRRDGGSNTRAPSLEESIQAARLATERPFDVTLVGLGGVAFDDGTTLSDTVRPRMTALMTLVLAQLTRLGVPWQRRRPQAPAEIWWDRTADVLARK